MDALTHAVEAYIGRSTTYGTRKDALLAVKLIFENIDTAYTDGTNVDARRNMLHASLLCRMCLYKILRWICTRCCPFTGRAV
ncbi:MAG: iron-containing alcohol dehydrogenase [Dorea sp.]